MDIEEIMKNPIVVEAIMQDAKEREARRARLAGTPLGFERGKSVNGYTLTDVCQDGTENGISELWYAVDDKQRDVVIKRPSLEDSDTACELAPFFSWEAKVYSELQHRNIAQCYDFFHLKHPDFPQTDVPHIVVERLEMEAADFIQDVPLLKGKSTINEEYLFRLYCVMSQAADGLSYMHEQGYVHCDFNPGQLMLDKYETVKIMDLSSVRRAGEMFDSDADMMITPQYFPKDDDGEIGYLERPHVDPSQDLYAFGMSVLEMLLPVTGMDSKEIAQAMAHTPNSELFDMVRAKNIVPEYLLSSVVANCFESVQVNQSPQFTTERLKDVVRSFGMSRYLSNKPVKHINALTGETKRVVMPEQDYLKKP